jgi:hypothetical protein
MPRDRIVLNFVDVRLSIPAPPFMAPLVFPTFILLSGTRFLTEICRVVGSSASGSLISMADGAVEQATGPCIAINQVDQMTRQNAAMAEESRARAGGRRAA